MKKIKYACIFALLFLCSCSVMNPVLTEVEKEKFVLKGDKVLYDGEVVGVFGPMEYEYSNGKFQKYEQYAKKLSLGLWEMQFEYPWIWRKKNR